MDIYKIFDNCDSGYTTWYGTEQAIINYLEEQKFNIFDYNVNDGFIKNLERYGLTFEIISVVEK